MATTMFKSNTFDMNKWYDRYYTISVACFLEQHKGIKMIT